jgi:tetratricopeptide (TPR) repeat protein
MNVRTMKLYRWLAFLLFACPLALVAGTAGTLVQQALAAEARFDSKAALGLFFKANAAHPDDPFILEKISKQYSDSIDDTDDPREKAFRAAKALAYAQRAVALEPKSAVNLLALAIGYGQLGFCSTTRIEIEYSRRVSEYAGRAIALDPNYGWAYNVLGRWNYEIASLGAGKRILAKLIYGGLPPASLDEAVRLLRHAVKLAPNIASHHAELGFAYLAANQPDLARVEFEEAVRMPVHEKYDLGEIVRARAALEKLP